MSLHEFAAQGNLEGIRSEVEAGVDVNAWEYFNETSFMFRRMNGIEQFRQEISRINAARNEGAVQQLYTPLQLASWNGHEACVRTLLKAGADVNALDGHQKTALMRASRCEHINCVRVLLEAGADVNARGFTQITALIEASQHGHESCVRLLLDAGADPFLVDYAFLDKDLFLDSLNEARRRRLERAENLFLLANASGSLPPEMLLLIFSAASHMTERRWLELRN